MQRLAALALVVVGCQLFGSGVRGSGTPKTEQRTVPAFDQLSIEGAMRADVTAGVAQVVELSGDDNIVPLIETIVNASELRIAPHESISPKLVLTAKIATQKLTALALSGSVQAAVHGIASDAFAIHTSGSTNVTASGAAKHVAIHVSGSSKVDANELHAEDVTIEVSGSADVDVYANGVLDVHISGSAHVRYAGSPREVHKDISGAGTIEPR